MQSKNYLVLTVLLALTGTAQAANDGPLSPMGLFDFKGTPEEQAACSPDATKFCSDAIPDTFRVLACLQEHRTRLRKVCLQVLEVHGQ